MALCSNGRICLNSFIASFIVILVPSILVKSYEITDQWVLFALLHLVCIELFIFAKYYSKDYAFSVSWRSSLLGWLFGFGILIAILTPSSWQCFGVYLTVMSFFHFSEYLVTAIIKPKSLSLNSFLLNHSTEYTLAAGLSWCEYLIERYFFPSMKSQWALILIGLTLVIFGEFVRILAMITAGSNFNHVIQTQRESGHMLITHGIYSKWRHPAYVGWFYWSIGTQLILGNPICAIGYTIASWKFFKSRIEEEEITLLNFFGEDYLIYQSKVPTGIPIIAGYRVYNF